jgi:FKBP-type peptidyl-prolyl cis-trans isomerase
MTYSTINHCCDQVLMAVCDEMGDYLSTDTVPLPNPVIDSQCCPIRDRQAEADFQEFQHRWTVRKTGGNILDWWDRSSLQIDTIRPGRGRRYPRCGDTVKITCVTKLIDGTGVDWSRKPFRFSVGDPSIMKGLTQGIQLMSCGERAKLYIPDYLAYGWWGMSHVPGMSHIPENADLVMTVELLEIRK